MLIAPGTIARRFEENLEWTTRLELVSAWATEHDGLRLLEERAEQGLRVRAIVGLWNYITEPEALRRLDQLGKLRLVGGGRRFHPKVYLFRGQGRTSAWIGSANFTAGGFAINEEAVFESENTESVTSWFQDLWRECGRLDENAIDAYERARKKNPPPPQPLAVPEGRMTAPMTLLRRVTDWDSYVAALRECDIWWSNRYSWSVLGEPASWRHTIEVLRDILTRMDLADLDDHDRRRVLGLARGGGWGLLGRMRNNSVNSVFGHNAQEIQEILHEVAEANDDAFPGLAFDAYEQMTEFGGIGEGIAARLLSLARPDRFVSVNDGSRDDLAQYSGLNPGTLGTTGNYRKLLKFIYKQRWFRAPEPDNRLEALIWEMRAALLDCFVYRPRARAP
ncbi:MAG: phospholipase D family protein [Alphaproteobacteria bacterium]|nr:phospholipase D family protein [Alphaproteobacteria bacterium]